MTILNQQQQQHGIMLRAPRAQQRSSEWDEREREHSAAGSEQATGKLQRSEQPGKLINSIN
jgi:hypothetical protein